MAVSSNTLFHFTDSIENLKGILNEGFRVNYCRETFSLNSNFPKVSNFWKVYVPMVSFCDIPLSEIRPHVEKYKAVCGIGLSKEWGLRQGLNPVLYTQKDSLLTEHIIDFYFHNFEQFSTDFGNASSSEMYRKFWYILCHTKNYKGVIRHNGIETENLPYNEKEWRYVPTDAQLLNAGINHDLILPTPAETEMRRKVREIKLTFEPEDIKYILLADKRMAKEMFVFLHNKFGSKAHRLMANIFTLKQIYNDY